MVTMQHPGGWWMASKANNEQGWVPASYLQPAPTAPPPTFSSRADVRSGNAQSGLWRK